MKNTIALFDFAIASTSLLAHWIWTRKAMSICCQFDLASFCSQEMGHSEVLFRFRMHRRGYNSSRWDSPDILDKPFWGNHVHCFPHGLGRIHDVVANNDNDFGWLATLRESDPYLVLDSSSTHLHNETTLVALPPSSFPSSNHKQMHRYVIFDFKSIAGTQRKLPSRATELANHIARGSSRKKMLHERLTHCNSRKASKLLFVTSFDCV